MLLDPESFGLVPGAEQTRDLPGALIHALQYAGGIEDYARTWSAYVT
jgi:hypothetical protein